MCESRPWSSAQVVVTVIICRRGGRPSAVRKLNEAVTGKPRSELREPQATEARSFVWGAGPCGSAKPVVALAGGVVRCVACSAALDSNVWRTVVNRQIWNIEAIGIGSR